MSHDIHYAVFLPSAIYKTFNMTTNTKRPFIKRFKTSRGYYVYDVNTNRILSVDREVYDILGDYKYLLFDKIRKKYTPKYGQTKVEKALNEIEKACSGEMLFLPDRPQELSNAGMSHEEFQQSYNNRLGLMILDVTEDCNLRCHYCSREWNTDKWNGKRDHMSTQTAFDAIDFLYDHSGQLEDRALAFYGGEPLLEFNLIKQCVDYARSKFGRDGVHFALTTNGILIDENKANYFADNQFSITVSIDGPQRVHDKHRVDNKEKGSYKKAIEGLHFLFRAYDDNALSKITINVIVTPPYDLDTLNDLWVEQPWLPKDIPLLLDYVNTERTNFLKEYDRKPSLEIYRRTQQRAFSTFKRDCLNEEPRNSPVANALIEPFLLRIYKRPFFQPPRKVYPLNGCCIPATRKVFVTCDGKLWICERSYGSPVLGSIYTGYDHKRMVGLVDNYSKGSITDCSRCWAIGMCSLCFAHAYTDGNFDIVRKRRFCKIQRKKLAAQLKKYCSILEQNAHAFDYMKSINFV